MEDCTSSLWVFVTRNTEYHLSGNLCVGARDRRSALWLDEHMAVGCELLGALLTTDEGSINMNVGMPRTGERLLFSPDLLTSKLEQVIHPVICVGESSWELREAA